MMSATYTDYQFKPQLRTVGPKYGKYLKQIQAALADLDGNTGNGRTESERYV